MRKYGMYKVWSILSNTGHKPYARQHNQACIFLTTFFSAVYNQEQLILQKTYALNKEIWAYNLWFIIKSGSLWFVYGIQNLE